MNLCRYCNLSTRDGCGCLHPQISKFLGNRFPTGIEIKVCQGFSLRLDSYTDVTLSCAGLKVKYVVKQKKSKK